MKKILIVKLGAIGDLFYALPAVTKIKSTVPGSTVDWLVSSSLAPALSSFSEIDHIIAWDPKNLYTGSLLDKLTALRRLRSAAPHHYDAIFLLHRHPGYLAALWGKGPIFTLNRKKNFKNLGVTSVGIPPGTIHESLAIEKVIDLYLVAEGHTVSTPWLKSNRIHGEEILLHIGGGQNNFVQFELKQWPYWHQLVGKILAETNLKLTLIGSKSDQDFLKNWKLPDNERLTNLVGKTSLPELIEIIKKARLVIGTDSGPLHIADQMGVPAVGIFGPTNPVVWGLISPGSKVIVHRVPCHPCYKDNGIFPPCPYDHRCMVELSPDIVMQEVKKKLNLSPLAPGPHN